MPKPAKATQTPPQGRPATPGTLIPCARCGWPCQINPADPTRLPINIGGDIHAATHDRGLCLECAVHWWLLTIDGLRWALQESGPLFLAQPQVQDILMRGLGALPQPVTAQPNWRAIVAQWEKPWPADWPAPRDGFTG
jgi:hypothetical protein